MMEFARCETTEKIRALLAGLRGTAIQLKDLRSYINTEHLGEIIAMLEQLNITP